MYCYRITKYNPKFRDSSGAYKKDDWISFSNIGKSFENKVLSAEGYLNTEEAYVKTISFFMDGLGIDSLIVTALEKIKPPKINDYWYSSDLFKNYKSIDINQHLSRDIVLAIARLALRKYLWCKLESEKMFVHFGYDYYMYIGSEKKPIHIISQIEALGLFVEKIDESPYMQTAYDEVSE